MSKRIVEEAGNTAKKGAPRTSAARVRNRASSSRLQLQRDPAGFALSVVLAGGIFYGARFLPNLDPFFHPQPKAMAGGTAATSGNSGSSRRNPVRQPGEATTLSLPPAASAASVPLAASLPLNAALPGDALSTPGASSRPSSLGEAGIGSPETQPGATLTFPDSDRSAGYVASRTSAQPSSAPLSALSFGTGVGRGAADSPLLPTPAAISPGASSTDKAVTIPALPLRELASLLARPATTADSISMISTPSDSASGKAKTLPFSSLVATTMSPRTRTIPLISGSAAFTWNGGSPLTNYWTTGGNWGGSAPGTAASADLTFGGATQTTALMDQSYSVHSLAFASGAGSFSLVSPAAVDPADRVTTLTLGAGGITQNSTSLQTMRVSNLALSASQTWKFGSGGLVVDAPISGNSTLTVSQIGPAFFPTVNGNLVAATATLSGNNSAFTGGLAVTAPSATSMTVNLVGPYAAGAGTLIGKTGVIGGLNINASGNDVLSGITGLDLKPGDGGTFNVDSGATYGTAGAPIKMTISASNTFSSSDVLNFRGGNGAYASEGGALTLTVAGDHALNGANTINLSAGMGTANNNYGYGGIGRYAAGGAVSLTATGNAAITNLANLNISGGPGGSVTSDGAPYGGDGGAATVAAASSNALSNIGTITLKGGAGGNSGATSTLYGEIGGAGGAVTLTASATAALNNIGVINATGGNGGIGGNSQQPVTIGGAGGAVVINLSADGAFRNVSGGVLNLTGGNGGDSNAKVVSRFSTVGNGGAGGACTLNLSSVDGLAGFTAINLTGGKSGAAIQGVNNVAGGAAQILLKFSTASNSISTNADVTFRNNAKIVLNGNNLVVGGIDSGAGSTTSLTGQIVENTSSSGSVFAVGDSGSHLYNGLIINGGTGALALVKQGSGIQTLMGANTFTGGTQVNAGTLAATGQALGTGSVGLAAGATLAAGSAANPTNGPQNTSTLTLARPLTVAGGSNASAVPSLTFDLGANGISDSLTLGGVSNSLLNFTGSGSLTIGFASATGASLGAGTYTLVSFASPHAGDVAGLDVSSLAAANNDFSFIPVGNLSGAGGGIGGGQFAWTFDGSGNVSALTFTLTSATVGSAATPEPVSIALLVLGIVGGLPVVGCRIVRLARRRSAPSPTYYLGAVVR